MEPFYLAVQLAQVTIGSLLPSIYKRIPPKNRTWDEIVIFSAHIGKLAEIALSGFSAAKLLKSSLGAKGAYSIGMGVAIVGRIVYGYASTPDENGRPANSDTTRAGLVTSFIGKGINALGVAQAVRAIGLGTWASRSAGAGFFAASLLISYECRRSLTSS